jgi:hypothetical protein
MSQETACSLIAEFAVCSKEFVGAADLGRLLSLSTASASSCFALVDRLPPAAGHAETISLLFYIFGMLTSQSFWRWRIICLYPFTQASSPQSWGL